MQRKQKKQKRNREGISKLCDVFYKSRERMDREYKRFLHSLNHKGSSGKGILEQLNSEDDGEYNQSH